MSNERFGEADIQQAKQMAESLGIDVDIEELRKTAAGMRSVFDTQRMQLDTAKATMFRVVEEMTDEQLKLFMKLLEEERAPVRNQAVGIMYAELYRRELAVPQDADS